MAGWSCISFARHRPTALNHTWGTISPHVWNEMRPRPHELWESSPLFIAICVISLSGVRFFPLFLLLHATTFCLKISASTPSLFTHQVFASSFPEKSPDVLFELICRRWCATFFKVRLSAEVSTSACSVVKWQILDLPVRKYFAGFVQYFNAAPKKSFKGRKGKKCQKV